MILLLLRMVCVRAFRQVSGCRRFCVFEWLLNVTRRHFRCWSFVLIESSCSIHNCICHMLRKCCPISAWDFPGGLPGPRWVAPLLYLSPPHLPPLAHHTHITCAFGVCHHGFVPPNSRREAWICTDSCRWDASRTVHVSTSPRWPSCRCCKLMLWLFSVW